MRMIDQEKVITALEQVKDEINPVSGSRKARLRDAVDDAIALLKEQPEIVRCKDCTYLNADTGICIVGIPHGYKDTFYCAYGKKTVKLE